MPAEEVRFMWLFVFFDLPTGTKAERHAAAKFRNFLKGDGYDMLQFSVYIRVCRGQAQVDKHAGRLTLNLPKQGSIRALSVTEQQYARMKTLVGTLKEKEKVASEQLVLL
jgi:CRISPR-associated protein Cas2